MFSAWVLFKVDYSVYGRDQFYVLSPADTYVHGF
jgi:hypothetical protein